MVSKLEVAVGNGALQALTWSTRGKEKLPCGGYFTEENLGRSTALGASPAARGHAENVQSVLTTK